MILGVSLLNTVACSQQNNGFECGIHLLVNLKVVLTSFILADVRMPFLEGCVATHLVGSSVSELSRVPPVPAMAEPSSSTHAGPTLQPLKLTIKKTSKSGWTIVKSKSPKIAYLPGGSVENSITLSNSFAALSDTLELMDCVTSENTNPSCVLNVSNSKRVRLTKPCKTSTAGSKRKPAPKCHSPPLSSCMPAYVDMREKIRFLPNSHGRYLSKLFYSEYSSHNVFICIKPNAKYCSVIKKSFELLRLFVGSYFKNKCYSLWYSI